METNRYNNSNNSKKKESYCTNCNNTGHNFKNCNDPVTSYGIILLSLGVQYDFKQKFIYNYSVNNIGQEIINTEKELQTTEQIIFNKNDNNNGIIIEEPNDISLFCDFKNKVKFLLIKRKHSLGFLEFIRGRYNIENIDGLIFLFEQMTNEEINKIKKLSFVELWNDIWGSDEYFNKNKYSHQNEFTISREKFNKLKTADLSGFLNLSFYTDNVKPNWDYAEWGFPKGRRNFKETNENCAKREFKEETGINDNEFKILTNIKCIDENFIGTNGIHYRHVYYLAVSTNDKNPKIDNNNLTQMSEVGDIGFFTYEEAIKKIRPYHIDRQKIITLVYIYVINYLIKKIKK